MSTAAISLGMKQFQNVCTSFGPEIAIMVRGMQGIGKSESVYQIAQKIKSDHYKSVENCAKVSEALKNDSGFRKCIASFWRKNKDNTAYDGVNRSLWHYDMGIPVIERRLSQLTEGDVTGLPFASERGGTEFRKTDWLLNACEFPCVLFLDELNRAIKGVSQATFQLADSKAFDGACLHDETRVYVAVNIGDSFDVQGMDPAEISRYAAVDLEPTVDDWLEWAKDNCDSNLVEFIRANPVYLEHKGAYEPNTKYPDRRAWGRLDNQLRRANLYKTSSERLFIHMASMMVGFSAANAFSKFVTENALDISAVEILENWPKARKRMDHLKGDKRTNKFIELGSKVCDYVEKEKLSKTELAQLKLFCDEKELPGESVMAIVNASSKIEANMVAVAQVLINKILFLTESVPADTTASKTEVAAPAPAPEKPAPVAKKRK